MGSSGQALSLLPRHSHTDQRDSQPASASTDGCLAHGSETTHCHHHGAEDLVVMARRWGSHHEGREGHGVSPGC